MTTYFSKNLVLLRQVVPVPHVTRELSLDHTESGLNVRSEMIVSFELFLVVSPHSYEPHPFRSLGSSSEEGIGLGKYVGHAAKLVDELDIVDRKVSQILFIKSREIRGFTFHCLFELLFGQEAIIRAKLHMVY